VAQQPKKVNMLKRPMWTHLSKPIAPIHPDWGKAEPGSVKRTHIIIKYILNNRYRNFMEMIIVQSKGSA
jgi:hypothetical protein